MPSTEIRAYAKLNLTLDILGKRPDGYHDLRMVMQSVSLGDNLRVEIGTGGGIKISTDKAFLPNDARNLAAIAALRFSEGTGIDLGGATIKIEKNIPVCAGLAGGSADGAAVLRALNDLTGAELPLDRLAQIGERVGSDVPFCVYGGTALAEGRGEIITPLAPLPPCYIILCKPFFSVSTPELFGRADSARLRRRPDTAGLTAALAEGDLPGVARRLYNVFEDVLPERRMAEINEIKNVLLGHGALGASMSGTGPTVFGIFDNAETARTARDDLAQTYRETFLAQTV